MKYEQISNEIIRVFYNVYNTLGYGFLEKVYEEAMIVEFKEKGIEYKNQCPIKVFYKNVEIGSYVADFIIEDKIIIEIKAIRELSIQDTSQLLNYLTSTDKEVGLLLNYGENPEIKRKVYDNNLKQYKIK